MRFYSDVCHKLFESQEELEKGGSIYCNSNSQKIFVEDKNGNTVMIWE